jgi:hypothetical protein
LETLPLRKVGWWHIGPIRESDLVFKTAENFDESDKVCVVRDGPQKKTLYLRRYYGKGEYPAEIMKIMEKGYRVHISRAFPSNVRTFVRAGPVPNTASRIHD